MVEHLRIILAAVAVRTAPRRLMAKSLLTGGILKRPAAAVPAPARRAASARKQGPMVPLARKRKVLDEAHKGNCKGREGVKVAKAKAKADKPQLAPQPSSPPPGVAPQLGPQRSSPPPSVAFDPDNTQDLKEQIVVGLLARLPPEALAGLHGLLFRLTRICVQRGWKGLTVGSGCTGSACGELWLSNIAEALEGTSFEPRFAVEHDKEKRRWIKELLPQLPVLFSEMSVLSGTQGVNYMHAQEMLSDVEDCGMVLCGFSCTSVSSLNVKSQQFGKCIAQNCGATGLTAASALDYLKRHHVLFAVLENVVTLGKDNAETVKKRLERCNYRVSLVQVSPHLSVTPQQRHRLYFLVVSATISDPDTPGRIAEYVKMLESVTLLFCLWLAL